MDKRKKKLIAEVAEGFRSLQSSDSVMDGRTKNLIAECRRLEESCLYMATTIFEWVKSLRSWRAAFVIFPIIFGSLAAWLLFSKQPNMEWFAGICALLVGMAPAVYKGLDFDVSLDVLWKHAQQFKTLQDRFRQAWSVTALGSFDEFQSEFAALMNDMDAARASSLTPPDRFFKKAQMKLSEGHYNFGDDQPEEIGHQ
ncbi:MAG: hypothetical protein V3R25_08910 [Nitrosomonadaceae bacterium]